jgi:nucleoporin SEH1
MVEEKTFPLGHGDFVLDMAIDHYGRRLATCSEDGIIKIFKRTNGPNGWDYLTETPPSSSGITRLSWSHPEFSMLLASCTDRSIIIWEEEDENKWKVLCYLTDFTSSISGLEFGPKHLGLRLAVCTNDGKVTICSPTDASRKEWLVRNSFGLEPSVETPSPMVDPTTLTTSLSWNTFPFDSPSLVVASGKIAYIWRMDKERKRWRQVSDQMVHSAVINHVAWAPNMGRSFHMIATASSDGTAKIWQIKDKAREDGDSILGDGNIEVVLMQTLSHKQGGESSTPCEVFRVEWNLTATTLATSCDDGIVRLWSPNLRGEWQLQIYMDDRKDQ